MKLFKAIVDNIFHEKTPIVGGEGIGKKMCVINISNDEYQKLKCFCEKASPPFNLTIVQDDILRQQKHVICEKNVYSIFKQNDCL